MKQNLGLENLEICYQNYHSQAWRRTNLFLKFTPLHQRKRILIIITFLDQ
jgi:hypothetical protein